MRHNAAAIVEAVGLDVARGARGHHHRGAQRQRWRGSKPTSRRLPSTDEEARLDEALVRAAVDMPWAGTPAPSRPSTRRRVPCRCSAARTCPDVQWLIGTGGAMVHARDPACSVLRIACADPATRRAIAAARARAWRSTPTICCTLRVCLHSGSTGGVRLRPQPLAHRRLKRNCHERSRRFATAAGCRCRKRRFPPTNSCVRASKPRALAHRRRRRFRCGGRAAQGAADAQAARRCDARRASRAPLPDAAARRLRRRSTMQKALMVRSTATASPTSCRRPPTATRATSSSPLAQKGIDESERLGRSMLNGYPIVNYGMARVSRADRCHRQAGDHADRHVDAEAHVARSALPPATPATSAAASRTRRRTSRNCRSRTASATTSISTGSRRCMRRTASSCIGASPGS